MRAFRLIVLLLLSLLFANTAFPSENRTAEIDAQAGSFSEALVYAS